MFRIALPLIVAADPYVDAAVDLLDMATPGRSDVVAEKPAMLGLEQNGTVEAPTPPEDNFLFGLECNPAAPVVAYHMPPAPAGPVFAVDPSSSVDPLAGLATNPFQPPPLQPNPAVQDPYSQGIPQQPQPCQPPDLSGLSLAPFGTHCSPFPAV